MSNASTEFPWEQFNSNADRIKFEQPGQSVVGTITQIGVTDFGTGKPEDRAPEVYVTTDDGNEVSFAASQWQLKAKLAELRPQVGDRIAVVFTGYGPAKPPKSPPKQFDVQVGRNQGNGQVSTPVASTSPPAGEQTPAATTAQPSASDLI
jgi:hypothetical protein